MARRLYGPLRVHDQSVWNWRVEAWDVPLDPSLPRFPGRVNAFLNPILLASLAWPTPTTSASPMTKALGCLGRSSLTSCLNTSYKPFDNVRKQSSPAPASSSAARRPRHRTSCHRVRRPLLSWKGERSRWWRTGRRTIHLNGSRMARGCQRG